MENLFDILLKVLKKDEKYFADLRLHPNDDGFAQYFDALLPQIKENI